MDNNILQLVVMDTQGRDLAQVREALYKLLNESTGFDYVIGASTTVTNGEEVNLLDYL